MATQMTQTNGQDQTPAPSGVEGRLAALERKLAALERAYRWQFAGVHTPTLDEAITDPLLTPDEEDPAEVAH